MKDKIEGSGSLVLAEDAKNITDREEKYRRRGRATAYTDEKNPSTAACFPGACLEKARSWDFGGDWKDRGEESKGRQRLKCLDSLCASWKDNVSPTQLIRASENRVLWHRMVVNVVNNGTAPLKIFYSPKNGRNNNELTNSTNKQQ